MDVAQMRKINDMTRVLQAHGFAEGADAAARQSQDLFGYETVPRSTSVSPPSSLTQNNLPSNADTPTLAVLNESLSSFSRFEKTTHLRLASIENDVASIVTKINEMIKAIQTLEKRQATQVESRPVTHVSETKQETHAEAPPQVTSKPPSQRTGDFKPGDVDLNKMFYCGQK